jgi:hypothetical protein
MITTTFALAALALAGPAGFLIGRKTHPLHKPIVEPAL